MEDEKVSCHVCGADMVYFADVWTQGMRYQKYRCAACGTEEMELYEPAE